MKPMRGTKKPFTVILILLLFAIVICLYAFLPKTKTSSTLNKINSVTDAEIDTIIRLMGIRSAKYKLTFDSSLELWMDVYNNAEHTPVDSICLAKITRSPEQRNEKKEVEQHLIFIPTPVEGEYNLNWKVDESSRITVKLALSPFDPFAEEKMLVNWYRTSEVGFNDNNEAYLFLIVLDSPKYNKAFPSMSVINKKLINILLDCEHDVVVSFKIKLSN